MKDFEIRCDESRLETTNLIYGKFTLGPFLPGQATTFGNALRRTLLAELSGLAITAFEIIGVMQEFSTLPGLRESILDLSLNLKQIVLTGVLPQSTPPIGFLNVRGPAIIRASDLKLPAGVYCTSPNQYIATLGSNGMLHIKFVVSIGKGYSIQPYSIYRSLSKIKLQPASNLDNPAVVLRSAMKQGASEQDPSAQTTYARQVLSATADSLESNGGGRRTTESAAESPYSKGVTKGRGQEQILPNKGFQSTFFTKENNYNGGSRQGRACLPPSGYAAGDSVSRRDTGVSGSRRDTGFQRNLSFEVSSDNSSCYASPYSGAWGGSEAGGGERNVENPSTSAATDSLGLPRSYPSQGQRSVEVKPLQGKEEYRDPSYYKSSSRRFAAVNSGARDSTGKGDSNSSYINIQTQLFQRITPHQVLPIDAVFTPVTQVNFLTEVNDRFETARENIVLEIWTNGSIHPKRALEEATLSLVQNFDTLLKKIQQASSFYKGLRYWTYLEPFKSSLGIDRRGESIHFVNNSLPRRGTASLPLRVRRILAEREGVQRILAERGGVQRSATTTPTESSDVSLSSSSGTARVSMQGRACLPPSGYAAKFVDEFQGNGVMGSVAEGHTKQRVTRQTQGEILRNKIVEKSEEELLEKLVKKDLPQSIYNLDIGNLNLSLQTFIFLKKAKIHTLLQLLTWISLKENHISHLESDLLNEKIIEELNDVIKQFTFQE